MRTDLNTAWSPGRDDDAIAVRDDAIHVRGIFADQRHASYLHNYCTRAFTAPTVLASCWMLSLGLSFPSGLNMKL